MFKNFYSFPQRHKLKRISDTHTHTRINNNEEILLVYGLPKETVTEIMMLYRNTKVNVRLPDGVTGLFDIIAEVLQRDTLAPYLFIIDLNYLRWTLIDIIKENGFILKKKKVKDQTIPGRKVYRCRQCRWYGASCICTYPSCILVASLQ